MAQFKEPLVKPGTSPKKRVLLASTTDDLYEYRRIAIATFKEYGEIELTTTYRRAKPSGLSNLKKLMPDCDAFLLVVGMQSGPILGHEPDEGRGKSLTELEFELAVEANIPIYVLITHGDLPLPEKTKIKNGDYEAIQGFRSRIRKDTGIFEEYITFGTFEEFSKGLIAVIDKIMSKGGKTGRPKGKTQTKSRVSKPPPEIEDTEKTDSEPPPTETVQMLPDSPAETDELRRAPLAEHIALRVRRIYESGFGGPFRINLYGPWGSGKTSLLEFIRKDLQKHLYFHKRKEPAIQKLYKYANEDPWIVVDFNAWEHQSIGSPWWPLMQKVYRQARSQLWHNPWYKTLRESYKGKLRIRSFSLLGKAFFERTSSRQRAIWLWITENCWRLRYSLAPVLLSIGIILGGVWFYLNITNSTSFQIPSQDIITSLSGFFSLMTNLFGILVSITRGFSVSSAQAAQKFKNLQEDPTAQISRHFKRMLYRIQRPVIVFIDDLDRCEGDYVVELLESIQTVFRHATVHYIIAADRRWIQRAYLNAYEPFRGSVREPGKRLGALLLEKTFQLSVAIPVIQDDTRASYWDSLLSRETGEKMAKEKVTEQSRELVRKELSQCSTDREIQDAVERVAHDPDLQRIYRQEAAPIYAAADLEKEAEHLLQPFAPLLASNPRAMKRLINSFGMRLAVVRSFDVKIERKKLALWTILDMRWPELAEFLEANPAMVNKIGKKGRLPNLISEDLKPLFEAQEVIDVVSGKIDRPNEGLDEETIRNCIKLHS